MLFEVCDEQNARWMHFFFPLIATFDCLGGAVRIGTREVGQIM